MTILFYFLCIGSNKSTFKINIRIFLRSKLNLLYKIDVNKVYFIPVLKIEGRKYY